MNKKIGCFFASEKGKEKAWRNFWLHKNIALEGDFYKNVMLHKKVRTGRLGTKNEVNLIYHLERLLFVKMQKCRFWLKSDYFFICQNSRGERSIAKKFS